MLTVSEVKLPVDHSEKDLRSAVEKVLKQKIKSYRIIKQAVDARKKDNVFFVYSVEAEISGDEEKAVSKCRSTNVCISKKEGYCPPDRKNDKEKSVLVVGSGPAGLFAAYVLALKGIKPVLIERGRPVDERKKDVDFFKKTGILDTSSNVQFGEGGAGTFSDGKLHTGIKDKRIRFVIETFAKMADGKADDILFMAKPHIGTDRLVEIIRNLRNEIIRLGGQVLFETRLSEIQIENGRIASAVLSKKGELTEETFDDIILAIGHSARDTVKMLHEKNVRMEQKPFAVGVRIEHKRKTIDEAQYGSFAGNERLGAADYKISCRPDGKRGVYSFCMCPGGVIVPAASEEGMVAVNGMSESGRNAENSNAALLVGIAPEDLGSDNVLAGIDFQRDIEKKAFRLGKGGYKAPCQLAGDLIKGIKSTSAGDVMPSYRPGVEFTDMRECLPEFVIGSIRSALPEFGRMIKGYDSYDAVLTGVESRSSSPVRITRDPETLQSVNVSGLYPCGEGAGYAGGIVSAAVDGIKCAEKIIEED